LEKESGGHGKSHKKKTPKHEPKHQEGSELVGSEAEVNLDSEALNSMSLSQHTVTNIQAQLEAKVQKELDELTIIANNQFSEGKHVYDYQLVRLSDSAKKEEKEEMNRQNQLYLKHTNLKRAEERLNQRYERAKAKLNEYKEKFIKQKRGLQQDHDTYVKIRD
jgi:hypothetical protein